MEIEESRVKAELSQVRDSYVWVTTIYSSPDQTQKVWRAREKRYSRGKGLLLGGYDTGILMDPDDLVFFYWARMTKCS